MAPYAKDVDNEPWLMPSIDEEVQQVRMLRINSSSVVETIVRDPAAMLIVLCTIVAVFVILALAVCAWALICASVVRVAICIVFLMIVTGVISLATPAIVKLYDLSGARDLLA